MFVRLIAFFLIAESMLTAVRVAQLVSQIGVYDGIAVTLIVLRGLLAAAQFMGGWLIAQRRLQGPAIASLALLAGAALTLFDVGLRLAPTGTYPWLRWHITVGYAAYALAAVWYLRRQ